MKQFLRRVWRLSWLVTLPVTVVFLLWAVRTHQRYSEFQLRQATQDELSLHRSGTLEFDRMVEKLKVERRALGLAERLATTELRTVSLYVREGRLQQLNERLPQSGHHYVEGGFSADGQTVQEVDVRYRGDSVYHWAYWKKSWRVKTKKDELFLGMRKFNLIAPRTPELLNNHLAYRLATHMGLISPYSEVVNLVLNGELLGVYILTEQLDESTIRRHGLMPGDVYSGDIAGHDRYVGHSQMIFDQPGAWSKVAVNNHFDEASLDPLRELLLHVRYAFRPEGQAGLSEILDIPTMGKAAALNLLVQNMHADNTHNWRFYYDPWKTKMIPIVWDPMGWHAGRSLRRRGKISPDIVRSHFHLALLQNGDFLRARQAAIEEFFRSGKDKLFLAEARELTERLKPAIEADPNHVYSGRHQTREYVVQETRHLPEYIRFVFEKLRDAYIVDPIADAQMARLGDESLRLSINGRSPVSELELVYDRPIEGPLDVRVSYSTASGRHEVDVSGAASVSGTTVTLKSALVTRMQLGTTTFGQGSTMLLGTAIYDLHVGTQTRGAKLLYVQARRAATRPIMRVQEVDEIRRTGLGPMYEVVRAAPIMERLVYSGDVIVRGDRVVEEDLLIEAGTRLLFEPGANLLVLGQVTALGTEEAPIEFIPLEEEQAPWGVFAIKGSGADGSRFDHCHFREGSGWKRPLAEYSAMFSIHHVQRVLVENCVFEDSKVVDDMVHGVYSEVSFRDCRFVRSLFDALDMDISQVEVLRCEFIESGNDAVDLMTARATVVQTKFLRSDDKGISVGEDSVVFIRDTLFDGCLIGVQTKDESTAVLINCDLVNCPQGVDGIKKNWRYDGGGEAFIYKSHISGSRTSLGADSHSRLVVRDCYVEDIDSIKRKRVDMDDTVDNLSPRKAATSRLVRTPDDLRVMDRHGFPRRTPAYAKTRGSRFGGTPKARARAGS